MHGGQPRGPGSTVAIIENAAPARVANRDTKHVRVDQRFLSPAFVRATRRPLRAISSSAGPTLGIKRKFRAKAVSFSCRLKRLSHLAVSSEWLHADVLQQIEGALLRGIGHGGHLEGRLAGSGWPTGIAHDGGEFLQERTEAVRGGAIIQGVGGHFV
jgi:hypothetical protein